MFLWRFEMGQKYDRWEPTKYSNLCLHMYKYIWETVCIFILDYSESWSVSADVSEWIIFPSDTHCCVSAWVAGCCVTLTEEISVKMPNCSSIFSVRQHVTGTAGDLSLARQTTQSNLVIALGSHLHVLSECTHSHKVYVAVHVLGCNLKYIYTYRVVCIYACMV